MTKVMIPTSLRPHVEGQGAVQIDGDSVGEVLQSLAATYPNLKTHLYDQDGKLVLFINVFVTT